MTVIHDNLEIVRAIRHNLKFTEAQYRSMVENSHDVVALFDNEGRYIYLSQAIEDMLGYTPDELVGRVVSDLFHPDDKEKILEFNLKNLRKGKHFINPDFRMRKKDGAYIWIEAHAIPILDHSGNVIAAQTINRDITKRKETESKLEESERINRLISTNSKDLISLYNNDEDPKRIYISPSCKEVMGYEQHEMIGRSPFDFIMEEDAVRMQQSIHPNTLGGSVSSTEYRAIKKDGSIIWLETISNPFFDNDGKIIGFQTSARDITQRKHWEEELQKATLKSQQATLKFRELLNEKNDLIGLFSHDMRSPINQIKGLAQLMEMSMDDKEIIADCIRKLNHAANRQLSLYRDILLMLKSDQMNMDQKYFKKIPLMMVVGKSYKNLEWEFRNKNINIDADVPQDLEVNIQLDLFIQAVQNLFSNAVKFSHPGSLLTVKGRRVADHIQLSVADQGIGFDPVKAESLFERFTKEGREGTGKEASTGLGLYLVKKIIDNHGGKISAHSSGDGKGSEFIIDLPSPR